METARNDLESMKSAYINLAKKTCEIKFARKCLNSPNLDWNYFSFSKSLHKNQIYKEKIQLQSSFVSLKHPQITKLDFRM